MADKQIEQMNNCEHLNPVQKENGVLQCGDCSAEIYNPIFDEVPTPPKPSIMERLKPKSKKTTKAVTKNDSVEFIGMGLSCPHCNKHIEIGFK